MKQTSYFNEKKNTDVNYVKIGLGVFAGLVSFVVLLNSYVIVPTGTRGVVTHFGKVQQGVLDEGLHFIVPFMTKVKTLSVRLLKSELKAQASSKDLQLITTEVAINWHINSKHVNTVYQNIGNEVAVVNQILAPSISEVFKATTALKTAEEIITQRNDLSDKAQNMLRERLAKYNIVLDEINIVDLDFTAEFSRAVEEKQIAEQTARKAEYVAQKATADAKAAVNTAKGQADSLLLNAQAQAEAQKLLRLTLSPELLQMKAIERWDGVMPQVMGKEGNLLFNIPTKNTKQQEKME